MLELIGKLHPLAVHLPIGFLTLLGVMELLALRRGKELDTANRIILLLTIPAALVSVIFGWLLAAHKGDEGSTLFWHRWLGTGVAVAVILLWLIRWRGKMIAYRVALVLTLSLLGVASHFGGTLVYGPNYFQLKANSTPPVVRADSELLAQPVFATVIQPFFDKHCVECHDENVSKNELRLDSAAHLLAGGKSGKLLEPLDADKSRLGQHIFSPFEAEGHMPPKKKPQPTASELAIIRWWINSGAPTNEITIAALKPGTNILATLLNR